MVVVVVCIVLLLVGVAVAARWGSIPVRTLGPVGTGPGRPTVPAVVRRYLWWSTVWTVAVLAGTVLAAGAGGRLVMRLLAHTSPDAEGALTEAGEVVGRISVSGTISLLLFGALPAGIVAASLYLLLRRLLPPGWWRPLSLAAVLLVVLGARLEPLRPENVDFLIVGPPWLAVLTFGLVGLLHAGVVVAAAGAVSRVLPEFSRQTLAWYAPLLVWLVVYPVGVLVGAVGALVAVLSRVLPRRGIRVPGGVATGRAVLVAGVLIALPGFVLAMRDITVS